MKRLLLVMMLGGFSFAASSQTEADPGTYQLMTTNVKVQEFFTTSILSEIQANRHSTALVVIKIGEFTWVRILSEETINDPSFIPLSEGVIEISTEDPLIFEPNTLKH